MSISCYTIGGNSLLIACTDLLLQRGHDVRGVVTASPNVAQWASQQGLAVVNADRDYGPQLSQKPFDYLFSIAHLEIVPADVLALPRHDAINFHDGLLPEYAGLNVPVWALINGESRHGVTWHIMTSQADAGDILKQHEFEIDETETALTLNARCFDAGIATFESLLDEVEKGATSRTPQDMTGRRYFSRADRPPAACFLDWQQPAAQLDSVVRATHFGNYPNPLGAAKILAGERTYVVGECSVGPAGPTEQIGTIVEAHDDLMRVVTGDGTLAIHGLAELDGRPITIHDFLSASDLKEGDQLDVVSAAHRSELTRHDRAIAKSEPFWTERLTQFKPVNWFEQTSDPTAESAAMAIDVSIPQSFVQQFGDLFDDAIMAAFSTYLAVVTETAQVDLAFEDTTDERLQYRRDGWESQRIPISLRIETNHDFDRAIESVRRERKRIAGRSGWLRDLIGRMPDLRAKPELSRGRLDAVGIHLVRQLRNRPLLTDWSSPVLVVSRAEHECELAFAPQRFSPGSMERFVHRFSEFLEWLSEGRQIPLAEISTLTQAEERKILLDWNRTTRPYPADQCIHDLFEQQVTRTPDAEAIVCSGQGLTYIELNGRANQLAARLREMGVKPDQLIGVCIERSIEMVVAILGIQKAGGAYVPLDPSFPGSRIAMMLHDSRAPIVITQSHLVANLPPTNASIIRIDTDWSSIETKPKENVESNVGPTNLAYLIYTSGSTGRPKGVMVEHRNVVNFFIGMDESVSYDASRENVLLAVTSLSFDISVLELLWTLTRGFKVVVYSERVRPRVALGPNAGTAPMRFGLFYFSSDEGERSEDKYRLLTEGAKFADNNGFVSVSTPERHFHEFGGLYPNPAITSAAVASITKNVQIRAGSVVVPLHHPIRIAEDWSLVDNLSNGRVGISFASGWQPVDFVIRPETYNDRHRVMYEGIETVRKLWRGESVEFPDANGDPRSIRTLPRPVQKELPVWVTTAGDRETWISAGTIGANILTHLLGQTIDEIADKIRAYRSAYTNAGHVGNGNVTLMLHTFVGDDMDHVRATVRKPMMDYLASSVSLVKSVASSWTAYKRKTDGTAADVPDDLSSLTQEEMDDLLLYSFERYFSTSSLFGTPDHCVAIVRRLRRIGVDEIACLIDFGIDSDTVLHHLTYLNEVRTLSERDVTVEVPDAVPASGDQTIGALIRHHNVTHLQCTPSMASMILADDEAKDALSHVRTLMIGGEAFPVYLARELRNATDANIINMYGPTETTIWSSTQEVRGDEQSILIGRPIANTQMYVLNEQLRLVPPGSIGELCIGGVGVVRGYHERPETTSDRFVENPFFRYEGDGDVRPSERIYRTGDLARYRSDGTLEFLGRVDQQVKVRGYRIELGEIETVLADYPEIQETVVVAREDVPGDKRLVAYYLGDPDRPIDEGAVRTWLRERLPAYMIPSHFVPLRSFPQTPNSKIDRKSLPVPQQSTTPSQDRQPTPLSSDVEQKIAKIWQEVLGITRAGRDDNFFEIGGHSLLAVKALRFLRNALDKNIVITDLFRFPTVRALAAYLSDDEEQTTLNESQQRGASRRELMMRRRSQRHE